MGRRASLTIVVVLIVLATALERASLALPHPPAVLAVKTEPAAPVFGEVELEARAAYVYDIALGKTLFERNGDLPLPLASVTKLMTGLVALENTTLGAMVRIDAAAIREEGDTGLAVGERWDVPALVEFTLTASSNDGAHALAETVGSMLPPKEDLAGRERFIAAMNDKARSLGLLGMYFIDETGLDQGGRAGAYGSAHEVALLLSDFLKRYPDVLEATAYATPAVRSYERAHYPTNTNKVATTIPGLLASKTGFTDVAGGNLAIAIDAGIGHPVAIVVLGSTETGRFEDARKLAERAVAFVTSGGAAAR